MTKVERCFTLELGEKRITLAELHDRQSRLEEVRHYLDRAEVKNGAKPGLAGSIGSAAGSLGSVVRASGLFSGSVSGNVSSVLVEQPIPTTNGLKHIVICAHGLFGQPGAFVFLTCQKFRTFF